MQEKQKKQQKRKEKELLNPMQTMIGVITTEWLRNKNGKEKLRQQERNETLTMRKKRQNWKNFKKKTLKEELQVLKKKSKELKKMKQRKERKELRELKKKLARLKGPKKNNKKRHQSRKAFSTKLKIGSDGQASLMMVRMLNFILPMVMNFKRVFTMIFD